MRNIYLIVPQLYSLSVPYICLVHFASFRRLRGFDDGDAVDGLDDGFDGVFDDGFLDDCFDDFDCCDVEPKAGAFRASKLGRPPLPAHAGLPVAEGSLCH